MNNIYLQNNKSIVPGDIVHIDGIDSKIIFEHHSRSQFPPNVTELKFKIRSQDGDDYGPYYILDDNSLEQTYLARYSLTKVGKPRPLDIKDIKVGNKCIIGKDIELAPLITNINDISQTSRSRCERFTKETADNTTKETYTILEIMGDYVWIIQNKDNRISYVFPYWFLYDAYLNLYKPKRTIIRNFDDF